ncbi:MAG: M20/M25/M40 family metallo-hydrolase [Actinobacteria bacterium]|nr:M20/M25/M40 family metallo-hydrolase [Actinomycetota bacterium]
MSYTEEKIDKWLNKNKDFIIQTLSELIQIKTENLPPTGNEKNGQEYLYNLVSKFIPEKNIDLFEIDEVNGVRDHPFFFPTIDGIERIYKNRPNLVVKIQGKVERPSLLLSGHIDTHHATGEKWKIFKDPFSGKIKNGWMYGRGSADMKSGTLAGFIALKCLNDLKIRLKGSVLAESVVDEEFGGVNGTIASRLRYPDINFAILAEPTDLTIGIETKGGTDFKVSVKEKSSGGINTESHECPNPIYKLSKIALALQKYEKINGNIKKNKLDIIKFF